MDMLEDYLRAVSRLLPRAQREDVVAELRDEILTRIEAREAERGRALTPDETEQLLREVGHPIVVAARYRNEPQHAVGPALYPYWAFFVRLALVLEIAISAIVFIARTAAGADPAQAMEQAVVSGLTGAMTLIGFATAAAWIIERKAVTIGYVNTWSVRDLRFLDFALWDWSDVSDLLAGRRPGPDRRPSGAAYRHDPDWRLRQSSAASGVAAIVCGVVCILWWLGLISFGLRPVPVDFGALDIDPGRLAQVDWPGLKAVLYWPVVIYCGALILFGAAMLAWPRGVRLRGALDIALGMAGMGLALWLWTTSPLAPILQPGPASELIGRVLEFFRHPLPVPLELAATLVVLISAVGAAFRTLGGLWELLTGASVRRAGF